MIEWSDDITEPYLTEHFSEDDLRNFIRDGSKDNVILKFLCHNQAVERHVKLVTECSSKVCTGETQNKLAKTIIRARDKMPKFETKKDFVA